MEVWVISTAGALISFLAMLVVGFLKSTIQRLEKRVDELTTVSARHGESIAGSAAKTAEDDRRMADLKNDMGVLKDQISVVSEKLTMLLARVGTPPSGIPRVKD